MARDIAFLALLALFALVGLLLFFRVRKLLKVAKEAQSSTKELATRVRQRGAGRAAATGAGIAFFGALALALLIRRMMNWMREDVLEE